MIVNRGGYFMLCANTNSETKTAGGNAASCTWIGVDY